MQIEMRWQCGVSTCAHMNRGRDMVCRGCGKSKTDEEYLMPDDIESAPEVTDSDLLRKALGGTNWRCRYCDSDQRRIDGLCQQCGSNQKDSTDRRISPPSPPPIVPTNDPYRSPGHVPFYPEDTAVDSTDEPAAVSSTLVPKRTLSRRHKNAIAVGGVLAAVASLGIYAFWPHTVHASVASVTWSHTVTVEKLQVVHESGFSESEPGDAMNVQSAGLRYHHSDHVLDHYTKVPYTVQEPCGQIPQTCTTTPKTCTSNKNGFATCTGGNKVCSGGGTKYCPATRYRDQPVYVDVPQYRPYYTWDVWRWIPGRKVSAGGSTTSTHWPDDRELNLGNNCGPGEKERTGERTAFYSVIFDKDSISYHPKSSSEFQRFSEHSKWAVSVDRAGIIHGIVKE